MESSDNPVFNSRLDLTELKEGMEAIRRSIGEWVVGQENMVDLLIVALLADGHVLLEGVPGSGQDTYR
jgi:MoxR-like ATPase